MVCQSERQTMEKHTTLYRFYDKDNNLLYVGITGLMPRRINQHAAKSEWHKYAIRAELEHFASRQEAAVAETNAIKNELPKYNIQHSSQYSVSESQHFWFIVEGILDDPIHQSIHKEIVRLTATAPKCSSNEDVRIWAYLNAVYFESNEDTIPCIPCRILTKEDYLIAAHGRVCDDYYRELREMAK